MNNLKLGWLGSSFGLWFVIARPMVFTLQVMIHAPLHKVKMRVDRRVSVVLVEVAVVQETHVLVGVPLHSFLHAVSTVGVHGVQTIALRVVRLLQKCCSLVHLTPARRRHAKLAVAFRHFQD